MVLRYSNKLPPPLSGGAAPDDDQGNPSSGMSYRLSEALLADQNLARAYAQPLGSE